MLTLFTISQGVLSKASAVQLGVAAVKGALSQASVAPEQVEDLYFGNVLQGGVGQSPARQVVIGSGLPESTEATTINKVSLFEETRLCQCGWLGKEDASLCRGAEEPVERLARAFESAWG